MSPEAFARVRAAFDAAMDHPERNRPQIAREMLADAPDLLAEVLALLDLEVVQANRRTQRAFELAVNDLTTQEQQSWIGRRVGRFQIIEEIGSGGMGRVFKCRNCDDPGQCVALKVVRPERFNRSLAERFSSERSILARLNHPGIAYFVDAGSVDGMAYIAMELVEGSTLMDYAKQHGLRIRQRLELFQELLDAVSHAHRALIIHRDIKSDNVLVRADGHIKLLDFGIAKPLTAETIRTVTQERAFTPISAAPEQILGEPSSVATDVYALGVLLYELISEALPFDASGRSVGDLEREVIHVPPPTMASRRSALGLEQRERIPDDLERIVAKTLRKEPEGRYRSAEQLQSDLARFLADEPISISGNGQFYRLRKFVVRHRMAAALGAIATVAIVSALVIAIYQNYRIRQERDISQSALGVLKEAFAAADPTGESGGNISARDVLDRSVSQITPLQVSNPEAYVSLAATIGETQLALGVTEPASNLLEHALSVAVGIGHQDQDRLRIQLARAQTEQSFVSKAKDLLAEIDPALLESGAGLLAQGRIAIRSHRWQEARDLLGRSIPKLPIGSSDWLFAQSQYAVALAETGRPEQAMRGIEVAESEFLQQFPERSDAVARLQLARLDVLDSAKDMDRLCGEGPDWVTRIRDRVGARTAIAGMAAVRVALACQQLGQNSRAADHYRLALEGLVPTLGAAHSYTYRAQFNLALTLIRDDAQTPEALAALQAATAGAEADSEPQAAIVATFRTLLSRELAKAKSPEALEAALRALTNSQNPTNTRELPDYEQQNLAAWSNYLFWSTDCAIARDRSSMNPSAACLTELQRTECRAVQQLLCELAPESKR